MLHQTYKRKYSDIEIKMNEGAGPFLIEMLQDLRRTEYVRHVDFEYYFQTLHVALNEEPTGKQSALAGCYVGRYYTRCASLPSPWLPHATAWALSRRSRLR